MSNTKQEVLWVVLISAFLLACIFYFDDAPFLPQYLDDHKVTFKVFFYVFLAVLLATARIYDASMKFYDEYSPKTVKASIINVVIWSAFWLCWCVFNLIVLIEHPFSLKLFLFSFLLTNGPGAVVFSFGLTLWVEQMKDWDTIKSDLIAQGEFEETEKAYRLTYQSLLYGILTIPLFLVVSGLYYSVFK